MTKTIDQQCHFIGIGGIGMSGLARILLSKKFQVSGSDLASTPITSHLIQKGATVHLGHSEHHVTPQMTVIYSTDVKEDNPEYQAALKHGCQMLHRSDLLLHLMEESQTLAVTGTHGKTTTSALLVSVLMEGGLDPSFAVGGMLPHLQTNAAHGKGNFFVAEADESDGTFLKYTPFGGIVTNIDLDHLDHFGSEDLLIESFKTFMQKVSSPQHLFWCGDDARLANLKMPGVSYGFGAPCQLRASHFCQKGWCISFDVDFQGKHYPQVEVALSGQHNALNALAVFGLALTLGIDEASIRAALLSFHGVGRRCEKKGEQNGVLMIDDYAHHPTEIKTTLQAIRRAIHQRRLVVVFQPHRYTRTQLCLGTFGGIFEAADALIVTDIYGAREQPIPGISHDLILQEVSENSNLPLQYIPRGQLAAELAAHLRPFDVLVTLGAGDITQLSTEVLSQWKQHPIHKLKVGVVFGGRSSEHEISLLSAKHVCQSLNPEYYESTFFGISQEGQWISHPKILEELSQAVECKKENASQKAVSEKSGLGAQMPSVPVLSEKVLKELSECDIVFPVLHGPFGEDGTIQGFFEMLGKAYVGCDYRSAAICMDKALTKKLMSLNGVPIVPFVDFSWEEWKYHREEILTKIEEKLHYPLFVKPVHLGSAIGVRKVEQREALSEAIDRAFLIDHWVLVENGLKVREIEFAVLGNDEPRVFPPGEVLCGGKVYDYESKYGPNSTGTHAKAELSPHLIEQGMQLAGKAYKAAGCQGMARVDFFLDPQEQFWLNEINPIPGFTKISLYPKICEVNGLASRDLMDQLIILGLQRKRLSDRVNSRNDRQSSR